MYWLFPPIVSLSVCLCVCVSLSLPPPPPRGTELGQEVATLIQVSLIPSHEDLLYNTPLLLTPQLPH